VVKHILQTHPGKFIPRPVDPANGTLPEGDLGMDQIMGLLNNK
jgi:hypothetical protein